MTEVNKASNENQEQVKQEIQHLQELTINKLKTCYDPEIPVDIWELGLIYELKFDLEKNLIIMMTLTSPMCPVAGTLPIEVENKIRTVPGIGTVKVELTWNPTWSKDMMSEVAQVELGFF